MQATLDQTTTIAPAKVETINQWPLDQVAMRLRKKQAIPAEMIDEAVAEYRKYMALLALGGAQLAMCSRVVDEVWHAHILFTRDYARFCQVAFGYFMHHEPATQERPITADARVRFVEAYTSRFGEIPAIWTTDADCSPDPSCDQGSCCNDGNPG